jgi:spermidine synthase
MSEWMEEVDVVYGAWRLQLKIDEVLVRRRGAHHDLLLFENKLFGRVLTLDGVVQTTERDEFIFHEMLVHVPLLAHPAPRRVLIIGGGDGGALEEVLKHDCVEAVTLVEIDEAVVECSREFLPSICGAAFEDPRATIVIDDGVAFVGASEDQYDVILVDSTDPVGPGEALFESSFYQNCRDRLAPGGVLTSQFGVPFAEPEWLARPYLRLTDSFPNTGCYLVPVPANYGGFLAFCMASGSDAPFNVEPDTLQDRFTAAGVETRYYTPEMHKAAFALPPYVAEIIS